MLRWAEVISPLLGSNRGADLTGSTPLNRRESFRKRQLHLSLGPSIGMAMSTIGRDGEAEADDDDDHNNKNSRSSNTPLEEHDTSHDSTSSTRCELQPNRYLACLIEEAGQNARRRRAESSGEVVNRTSLAGTASAPQPAGSSNVRRRRFAPLAASGLSQVSDPAGLPSLVLSKRRLSRVSSESARRLSLRGDSDHSRPGTANGNSNRASTSFSSSSHGCNGKNSVRNSVHSDRRASSPVVLFNIFEQRKTDATSQISDGHGDPTDKPCVDDHETNRTDLTNGSALGLSFAVPPPSAAQLWSPVPRQLERMESHSPRSESDTATSPSAFSAFATDYSPSLAPTTPRTPESIAATLVGADEPPAACAPFQKPRLGHRKPSPRIDPKDLEGFVDGSYEIVPPAASIPVSASMPVIVSHVQHDLVLKRAVSPQPGQTRGKIPLARKWGKTAADKLASKINLPPVVMEPSEETDEAAAQGRAAPTAVIARRFGGLAASFSSKTLSSHLNVPSSSARIKNRSASSPRAGTDIESSDAAMLSASPPAVTMERILPPEVMISRFDEIGKLQPVVARYARRELMSAGDDEQLARSGVISPASFRGQRPGPRRPSTSAGTVTASFNVVTPSDVRPQSPWSTTTSSSAASQECRSPRMALQDVSTAAMVSSNRNLGLPAPPRQPKKQRSAGAFTSSASSGTLPRCQSSSVLAERVRMRVASPPPQPHVQPPASPPKASPILNPSEAFPSPEKTASTFNARQGKWKRHSTFSIVEGRAMADAIGSANDGGGEEDKENERYSGAQAQPASTHARVKGLWSFDTTAGARSGAHDDDEDDDGNDDDERDFAHGVASASTSSSFTFSAYYGGAPSSTSSRAQSHLGGGAAEDADREEILSENTDIAGEDGRHEEHLANRWNRAAVAAI